MGVVVAALLLSACPAYTVTRYSVSVDNVEMLRSLQKKYPQGALKVSDFISESGPQREILCRGAGPVAPPDQKTFEQYLQAALRDELRMAGVYSDKSKVELSAKFHELDFSSIDGTWNLAASVSASPVQPFQVSHVSSFSSSPIGDNACNLTAQAFMPATQDFLKKLVSSPEFEKAFAASEEAPAPLPTTEAVPGT
ncbi:hypothetical protein OV207_02030 [Corallococcus sp. BB11-1]|uniref:hypothetical protein n=1 Tax=Corallococcus sp. BB11-1 TaxID=2996783 RepID=UPI00226DE532|nr:hypothetical protein [Corallococcus sp. BB11-1]MCY1030218.1 hypothetical protein [Corallococcus sp. BB11-1]